MKEEKLEIGQHSRFFQLFYWIGCTVLIVDIALTVEAAWLVTLGAGALAGENLFDTPLLVLTLVAPFHFSLKVSCVSQSLICPADLSQDRFCGGCPCYTGRGDLFHYCSRCDCDQSLY